MNALKIAKDLDREGKFPGHICYGTSPLLVRAANMLRKQQAEIGALKQIIDANNLNQNIGQFVKPANKPVAWAREDGVIAFHEKTEVDSQGFKWFPLYTHSVKELTDEEIIKVYEDMLGVVSARNSAIDFARAILRKAQEK